MKQGEDRICIPQMLMIGASGRNSGKTTLAIRFIDKWKKNYKVVGLKVITIQSRHEKCPRGGDGCGMCTNLKGDYEIREETDAESQKDTSLLLASGAEKVYMLRVLKGCLHDGVQSFLERIDENTIVICESNSLRQVVNPGCFIMIDNAVGEKAKKSALQVKDLADVTVRTSDHEFQFLLEHVDSKKNMNGITVAFNSQTPIQNRR